MEKETHIYQHYIPECYLRNFTENNKEIFVYRKNNNKKIYNKSISKVGGVKRLYDIDDKFLQKEFKSKNKFIEKEIFAQGFEPFLNSILIKIITSVNSKEHNYKDVLTEIDRDYFAELIAIQYIRHPNFIEKQWDFFKERNNKRFEIIKAFITKMNPNAVESTTPQLHYDENYSPALHSNFILDSEWRYSIQEQLVDKIWIFYYTKENVFTSDNPIILKPHINGEKPFYEGFGMNGVEVIFPISKNIILTIWDKKYFSNKISLHNSIQILNSKTLREYNLYQYYFSNFEVYSALNDMTIIEKFVESNNNTDFISTKSRIQIF